VIEMPADAEQYARHLYEALRELDGMNLPAIYLELPPIGEAWRAVRDRVYRATAGLRPDRYA
jgi:L-threonylcarbamoyladenylate synthase